MNDALTDLEEGHNGAGEMSNEEKSRSGPFTRTGGMVPDARLPPRPFCRYGVFLRTDFSFTR
jgi:hypothetical protein